jgi:hypothetical protein
MAADLTVIEYLPLARRADTSGGLAAPAPGDVADGIGARDVVWCPAPAPKQYPRRVWGEMYPHIKRLYVHEKRKLRDVIVCMQSEYGFSAT